MSKTQYILDNNWVKERERLASLEQMLDPATIDYIGELGITDGWRCLELGAGGGSITEWLCQHVGPSGQVVAIDINTRFLDALDYPNLEVRQKNVVTDQLGTELFDLVHTRWLLHHLPEREAVLQKMLEAVKPGGWLLVEERDSTPTRVAPTDEDAKALLFNKVLQAIESDGSERGVDPYFGLRLFGLLRSLGLESVRSEGRNRIVQGSSSEATMLRMTFEQRKDVVVNAERVTEAEYDEMLALLDNESFAFCMPSSIAAWGKKPL